MSNNEPVILGQPRLKDFLVTVCLECSCESKAVLLVACKPGTMFGCMACMACRQVYRVDSLGVDARTGQLQMSLSKVAQVPQAPQTQTLQEVRS